MKNQNKLSNLFNLDYVDVGYGVITSAVTGGLTALYNALNSLRVIHLFTNAYFLFIFQVRNGLEIYDEIPCVVIY